MALDMYMMGFTSVTQHGAGCVALFFPAWALDTVWGTYGAPWVWGLAAAAVPILPPVPSPNGSAFCVL